MFVIYLGYSLVTGHYVLLCAGGERIYLSGLRMLYLYYQLFRDILAVTNCCWHVFRALVSQNTKSAALATIDYLLL